MRRRLLIAAGGGLLARPALAQGGFPNRPVRVVIPAGPGGAYSTPFPAKGNCSRS